METIKLNIYQKLLVIQKKILGLEKDKSSFNFKYVTGDKVLGEVKPLMNDLGLLLKQEVLSIENTRQDYQTSKGNKSEILSKVEMRFTWVDTETGDTDINLFGANGQNDWDKGVGSALTYAERYFLLKYFHIATDEDDIDNDQRKTSEPVKAKAEPVKKETPKTAISPNVDPKHFVEAKKTLKDSGCFSDEEVSRYMNVIEKAKTNEKAIELLGRIKTEVNTRLDKALATTK
jgi:hypothetical protein